MDKKALETFLILARTKTYAGNSGTVTPAFPGSRQMEYREGDFLYRDVFNIGNAIFMGLETVYFQDTPVLSSSYFGNFRGMTEEEVDTILRRALMENKTTRLWYPIEWSEGDFRYTYTLDAKGSIDEFAGSEEITKKGTRIYFFYQAGGYIGG